MDVTELIVSLVYNDKGKVIGEKYHGELIRCRDCKHTEIEEDGDIICTFWDFCGCEHSVLEHGYCDRAERRNDETD